MAGSGGVTGVVGVGIDVVDVDRFRRVAARTPGIVGRLFTVDERRYAERRRDPTERLAARFAAKEAAMKAMGVGVGACGWREIEVVRTGAGRPAIRLEGGAQALAEARGITGWHLSLSHTGTTAAAVAIALAG